MRMFPNRNSSLVSSLIVSSPPEQQAGCLYLSSFFWLSPMNRPVLVLCKAITIWWLVGLGKLFRHQCCSFFRIMVILDDCLSWVSLLSFGHGLNNCIRRRKVHNPSWRRTFDFLLLGGASSLPLPPFSLPAPFPLLPTPGSTLLCTLNMIVIILDG